MKKMTHGMIKKQNTVVEPTATFETMLERASTLVKSGFLPKDIDSAEKALVVMQTGKELGMGMMQSFRSLYVVGGKPALYAQAMRALVENSEICEKFNVVEASERQCRIVVKRRNREEREIVFTWAMASRLKTQEIVGWEQKQTPQGMKSFPIKKTIPLTETDRYKNMPETMLEWRATSKACRTEFPELVLGLYTPEELAAHIDVQENEHGVAEIKEVNPPPQQQEPDTSKEIADDKLGEFVMPNGNQYAGLRLIEIVGQETETGGSKGLNFLEQVQETHPDLRLRNIVRRFLTILMQ
jgi:hypothetical protein